MKILILSDLHNDVKPMSRDEFTRDVDVVVLAGDIHEGVHAQMWAREAFPDHEIVQIAGNHEFYGKFWRGNLRRMREKAQSLGIHFLENESITLGGVRFLGCTLWTDFMLYGEHLRAVSMMEARQRMNDYHLIKLDRKPGDNADFRVFKSPRLVPELTRLRHLNSAEWLDQELKASSPKDLERTVVITHHAPHMNSVPPGFERDILSPAYASDLSHLMGYAPLWIHGHIHENQDYMLGDTRVVCNPRGYPDPSGDALNFDFDPGFVVEL